MVVIFFKRIFETQLIYSVVLISAAQQRDSVIHMYIVVHIRIRYGDSLLMIDYGEVMVYCL